MAALTDYAENQTLNWLTVQGGGNAPVAPVGPLKVALMRVNGDDATAGTEVSGGSYARQNVTFAPSASGQAANTALIRFDNMPDIPNPGVVGFEVWDSAATPKRWWYAPLTTPRTYAAGDAAEFPAGELVLAID